MLCVPTVLGKMTVARLEGGVETPGRDWMASRLNEVKSACADTINNRSKALGSPPAANALSVLFSHYELLGFRIGTDTTSKKRLRNQYSGPLFEER